MRFWIALGMIVAVAVTGLALWRLNARGQPVEAAVVQVGEIEEFVDEQGVTSLPRTYVISMPFEGQIEPISLSAGDPVRKGEPVAQIVPQDLANEVAIAQAAVERLQAQIAENSDVSVELTSRRQAEHFVESMADTVQAAATRKTATSEKMQLAESLLGRLRRLLPRNAATEEEVDRAEFALVEAQVDYQQSDLIWRAMESIQAATALLPTMINQQIARKDLSRAVLEKQKAEADVRLRQAITRQERGVMRSPIDGVVLERLVDNEQFLAAGAALLKIGRLEDLEVEAEILSEDAVRIRPGDDVEIYGPALEAAQGEGVRGVVHRIHPEAFTKRSSLGVEQQRVRVVIRFSDSALDRVLQLGVRVGYRVRVRITTETRSNALIIPRSAIFRSPDGGWRVYRIDDGIARLTPIETGLMNDEWVEVIQGLSQDHMVILAPENTLTEGARVTPLLRHVNAIHKFR